MARRVVIVCGRYQFTENQSAEILQIIQEIEQRYGTNVWTPGEICPTALAPVLVAKGGDIHSELQHWGYKLYNSLVINARAESAAEKPLFRGSVAVQRCVIPSTGFYEWSKEKHKYLFTIPGEAVLYMAGLYSVREGKPCYCILTTKANESTREIHHRMPLVLQRKQILPWLYNPRTTSDILHQIPPMLQSVNTDEQLRLW